MPLEKEDEDSSRSALKGYLDAAKLIRSNNFENSIADNLERIISGDFDLLRRLAGLGANDNTYDLSKAFITLAVPSLEGKTQFAFVLEKVRPLYFALGAINCPTTSDIKAQPIYLNFENLNRSIQEFAQEDIKLIWKNTHDEIHERIKKLPYIKKYTGSRDYMLRITADELKKHQNHLKFSALGLLVHLVNDAKSYYDIIDASSRPSWLEYHANRKTFKFFTKSIDEIPPDFFKGYCLFLDEYEGMDYQVFLRNLAQVVGLRCVISNTNDQISSFLGIDHLDSSKTSDNSIWSIVVNELKMGNYQTLNALAGIEENINWIYENAISDQFKDDRNLCSQFFNDFKEKQILELRPGVSFAVGNAINKFKSEHSDNKVTFEYLLGYITNELSKKLLNRKPYYNSIDEPGEIATLCLISCSSYNRKNQNPSLNSRKTNLDSHFYYLINPSDPAKWIFLTLATYVSKIDFVNIFNEANPTIPLRYIDEKDLKPVTWKHKLTYFKSEEILTILACMNLVCRWHSFVTIFQQSINVNNYGGLVDTSNIEKNMLTFLAMICFSHSSHRDPGKVSCSFSGQSGTNFLKNIFISSLSHYKSTPFKVTINFQFPVESSNFKIHEYLDRITIPYLYVSNAELPDIFKTMLSRSEIGGRSINFGKIDISDKLAHFKIEFPYYYRAADNCVSSRTCRADYKNWQKVLLYKHLFKMVTYAKKLSENFCIIVCKAMENPRHEAIRKFNQYCSDHRINAYKIKLSEKFKNGKIENRTYNVLRINENIIEDHSMMVLVIELDEKLENVKQDEEDYEDDDNDYTDDDDDDYYESD